MPHILDTRRPITGVLLLLIAVIACDTRAPTAPGTPTPGVPVSTLTGQVTSASTLQPIASAVVSINVGSLVRTTVTNAAGTYRLEALPEGRAALTIRGDGFEPRFGEVLMTAGEIREDIVLVPLSITGVPPTTQLTSLTGVVTNRNTNQPVAGATVTLRLENGLAWFTTTDTFGQFTLTNLPLGATGDLRVERSNFIPEDRRMTIELQAHLLLSLSPLF